MMTWSMWYGSHTMGFPYENSVKVEPQLSRKYWLDDFDESHVISIILGAVLGLIFGMVIVLSLNIIFRWQKRLKLQAKAFNNDDLNESVIITNSQHINSKSKNISQF